MPNTSFWTEDALQVRDYARVGYQNWSSDATPVNLYHSPPIDPAAPLTWNNSNSTFTTTNYLDQRSGKAKLHGFTAPLR